MAPGVLHRMEVLRGDITRLGVDAIVNAANRSLLGGGGVDGAIHRAAGPDLLAECKTLGGCETGEAKITKGYRLAARYVIHTVGPVYHASPRDPVLLGNCYKNALELAAKHGCVSVAFPAISCGVYGYPMQDACRVAVRATRDFLAAHELPEKVLFVLFDEPGCEIYKNRLRQESA